MRRFMLLRKNDATGVSGGEVKKRTWHRGGRFSRAYWWSDDKYSYALVTGTSYGWTVSAYGHETPPTFKRLKDAKAWVEKHLTPKRRTQRQGEKKEG